VRGSATLCLAGTALLGGVLVAIPAASAAPKVVPTSLVDVACPIATRCFAVGSSFMKPPSIARSLVERWNGSTWSVMKSPNASSTGYTWLSGIACTSATSCMTVGNSSPSGFGGKAFAARLSGNAWMALSMPAVPGGTQALLRDVACTGPTSCFAVGEYFKNGKQPLAMRWNGTKWRIVPAALPSGVRSGRLLGVDCASSNRCFAVGGTDDFSGDNVAFVAGWNGTKWVVHQQFSSEDSVDPLLRSVSCPTTKRCYAVGNNGSAFPRTLVTTWTGGAIWTTERSKNRSSMPENNLSGVSCWTATACLAVGDAMESHAGPTHSLSERRSASGWSLVLSPSKDPQYTALYGIDCSGAKRCFAVGSSNSSTPVVILKWNGTRWSNVKPG
jgi:hypothetical protein